EVGVAHRLDDVHVERLVVGSRGDVEPGPLEPQERGDVRVHGQVAGVEDVAGQGGVVVDMSAHVEVHAAGVPDGLHAPEDHVQVQVRARADGRGRVDADEVGCDGDAQGRADAHVGGREEGAAGRAQVDLER